jgi:hypothetical protein
MFCWSDRLLPKGTQLGFGRCSGANYLPDSSRCRATEAAALRRNMVDQLI